MQALSVLYLFLPAFVANAAPVLARKIPGLRDWTEPVSVSEFGSHKTYRGFAVGIAAAALCAILQFLLHGLLPEGWSQGIFADVDDSLLFGALIGTGALIGDLAKSWAKRRIGLQPGRPWPVFDGIDYIVGAIIFATPLYVATPLEVVILIVSAPLLSLAANTFSYLMGWKEVWY